MAAQTHLKLGEVSAESGTNKPLNESSVLHTLQKSERVREQLEVISVNSSTAEIIS